MPFPTFAKSTHPDVLASIRETADRFEQFQSEMRALSERLTGEPSHAFYAGSHYHGMTMTGISAKVDPATLPGRWKKPCEGMQKPFKNNPVAADLEAVRYLAASIPGRGNLIWGHGRIGTGTIFEFEGAIYSHLGFDREPMNDTQAAAAEQFGWTEIVGSEFHRAFEGENARRAQLREKDADK